MTPPQKPNSVPSAMIVMSPASYRTGAFADAARSIGVTLIRAIDMPPGFRVDDSKVLGIDFADPEQSVERIVEFARVHEERTGDIPAILAIDDRGALIAAQASSILGLSHNDPGAALAARDKYVMREKLAAGGVPVPSYTRVGAHMDPGSIAESIAYPCVIKPLLMSGSRGVIRADNPDEFVTAFNRTRAIVEASGMPADQHSILIEQFVLGFEVALEGLLTGSKLQTLAIFDKPDPLDGPFFEETLYITPSRLPIEAQAAISQRTSEAAAALGLREGPLHAELRFDRQTDDIWLIELAGRSIGGLCSSVLEFGAGMCLEELILRHATGLPLLSTERGLGAAGVMMIPIPKRGVLRCVGGVEDAAQIIGVTGIEITAPLNQPIVPLPEGESYLGFIFARGKHPEDVERALRQSHALLEFTIAPMISLQQR